MRNAILVIYQDIDSGAKVVTEQIISHLRVDLANQDLIIHRQNPHQYGGSFSAIKNFTWSFLDCVRFIRKHHRNTAIIYTPYFLAALVASLMKKKQQRVIFHFHGDHTITHIPNQPGWSGWLKYSYIWLIGKTIASLQFAALRRADKLLFVAKEAYLQIATKYHLERSVQQVVIVPNGVSTHQYHPPSSKTEKQTLQMLRRKLQIHNDTIVLLYSGRIDEKKGIHHILSAMRLLKTRTPNKHHKLLIMHPSYRDKDSAEYIINLHKTIASAQLDVTFITQPEKLAPYYQLADVCLLPSEQEMMPLVMLESLACATPFIGTKKGNIASILSTIHPQLILSSNSPQAIAKKITWFTELNKQQRKLLQKACLATAVKFTWSTTAQKVFATILEFTN